MRGLKRVSSPAAPGSFVETTMRGLKRSNRAAADAVDGLGSSDDEMMRGLKHVAERNEIATTNGSSDDEMMRGLKQARHLRGLVVDGSLGDETMRGLKHQGGGKYLSAHSSMRGLKRRDWQR
jgi:hypothetical protein